MIKIGFRGGFVKVVFKKKLSSRLLNRQILRYLDGRTAFVHCQLFGISTGKALLKFCI